MSLYYFYASSSLTSDNMPHEWVTTICDPFVHAYHMAALGNMATYWEIVCCNWQIIWRDPTFALMCHAYYLSCNLSFPCLCRHRYYFHIRDMCIVCTASKQIWLQNADWGVYTCRYMACNGSLPLLIYKKYPFTICADIWIDLTTSGAEQNSSTLWTYVWIILM